MGKHLLLFVVIFIISLAMSWLVSGECYAIHTPAEVKSEGYTPHEPGTVRIWDANGKYTMKHYDMRAWKDRANWSQVPCGVTDYQFSGDCILEGENFWVSLHSSHYDSVFLYAKTDAEATPGRHNEMYRVFYTPTGLRNYGSGSQFCRILRKRRYY